MDEAAAAVEAGQEWDATVIPWIIFCSLMHLVALEALQYYFVYRTER